MPSPLGGSSPELLLQAFLSGQRMAMARKQQKQAEEDRAMELEMLQEEVKRRKSEDKLNGMIVSRQQRQADATARQGSPGRVSHPYMPAPGEEPMPYEWSHQDAQIPAINAPEFGVDLPSYAQPIENQSQAFERQRLESEQKAAREYEVAHQRQLGTQDATIATAADLAREKALGTGEGAEPSRKAEHRRMLARTTHATDEGLRGARGRAALAGGGLSDEAAGQYAHLIKTGRMKPNGVPTKERRAFAEYLAEKNIDLGLQLSPSEYKLHRQARVAKAKLVRVGDLFKPEWVGPTQAMEYNLRAVQPTQFDKFLGSMPQERAEFVMANVNMTNEIIKFITGAQMSEFEAQRILKGLPKYKDRPEVWQAGYNNYLFNLDTEIQSFGLGGVGKKKIWTEAGAKKLYSQMMGSPAGFQYGGSGQQSGGGAEDAVDAALAQLDW